LATANWDLVRTPLRLRLAVASRTAIDDAIAMCLAANENVNAALRLLRDYQRSQQGGE
jgi:hypothetical protein